jgi:hypothetical protein
MEADSSESSGFGRTFGPGKGRSISGINPPYGMPPTQRVGL